MLCSALSTLRVSNGEDVCLTDLEVVSTADITCLLLTGNVADGILMPNAAYEWRRKVGHESLSVRRCHRRGFFIAQRMLRPSNRAFD